MLSPEKQKKKFLSIKAQNSIKAGSTAFLISALWFNKWKLAVGIESSAYASDESSEEKKPVKISEIPPINNSILVYDNGKLKPTLTEKYDFIILSPPLWKLLYEWYPGKGPEIQVEIIDHPVFHVPVPILSELTFSVFYSENIKEILKGDSKPTDDKSNLKYEDIKVNKYQTICDIKEKVCEILDIDPDRTAIRDFWNHNDNLRVLSDKDYIYSKHLVDTQELLLQAKDTKSEPKSRNRLVSRTNSSMTIVNVPMLAFRPTTQGHVGLINLGNTCFFNSAVQALSHTDMLAAFFMNANWRDNINSSNRFSTNGLLTNAYAQIVNDIWKKKESFLSPKRLLDTIAEYAPRFGDHQQHDAQELMIFLLDYIHEDLNRVNKNVYIEGVEGDSSSEQESAEAAWKRHKLTNDSIIVDLFHGQLESQLECPFCHGKKIVFDPYLCVTLPMPTERMSSVRYFYVPYDMKKRRFLVKIYAISTTEEDNVRADAIKRFNIFSNNDDDQSKEKNDDSNDQSKDKNYGDSNDQSKDKNDDDSNDQSKDKNDGDSNDQTKDKNDGDSNDKKINTEPIGPDDHRNCLVIDKDDLISNFGIKLPPALRKSEYIVFEIPDDRKMYTFAFVSAELQKKGVSGVVDGPVLVEVPENVLENQNKIVQLIQKSKSNPKTKNSKKKKNTKQKQNKKKQSLSKSSSKKKEKEKKKVTQERTTTITTRSSSRKRSQVATFSPSRTTKKKQPILLMQTRSRENKKKQEEQRNKKQQIEEEEEEEINKEEENENEDEEETEADVENQIKSICHSISDEMQNAAEERFNVYWEESKFMMIDSQRKLDLAISPTISDKLIENLNGDTNARMYAEAININGYENVEVGKIIGSLKLSDSSNNYYFFERFEYIPYLSLTSVKVTLNPLLSRTSEGFKWQAVLPISKDLNHSKDDQITLTKCLECFSYPDKLDELNEWFCPTCRKLVRAIAKLDIWSVPDNLILHLKRFVYNDGNFKKVFGKVSFPEIIDMQPYVRGPQNNESNLKYKIHAVINHIGTMDGGHYTTNAYSQSEQKWFTYNDEAVYQTSENITYSELPYVLFYHRITDAK